MNNAVSSILNVSELLSVFLAMVGIGACFIGIWKTGLHGFLLCAIGLAAGATVALGLTDTTWFKVVRLIEVSGTYSGAILLCIGLGRKQ